jgi:phosphohistidine phosphatase
LSPPARLTDFDEYRDDMGENWSAMTDVKRLLLLRHAKSSWDEPALADHDRPLAPRGRRAAKLIGAHLRRENLRVCLVLCSSARRARETLDLVAPSGEVRIERELYGASAAQLLDRARRISDEVDTAMVIGHNPGMQDFAVSLVHGERLAAKFPTGALATLVWRGPWAALEPGHAELVTVVTPRELA